MRRNLLLLALALAPGAAQAQSHRPNTRPTIGFHQPASWIPFVGARYSSVQGMSGSVLLLRNHSTHTEQYSGWLAAGEVGLHGWSASVGEGGWAAISGASLRTTYLHTWGSGGRLAGGQSFVGGELRASVKWWTFGAGWYRRVAGHAPGDGSTFAFTAGLGY